MRFELTEAEFSVHVRIFTNNSSMKRFGVAKKLFDFVKEVLRSLFVFMYLLMQRNVTKC